MVIVQRMAMGLLLLLGVGSPAWGHGFSLFLDGNALDSTSNDYPGNIGQFPPDGNRYLFGDEFVDILGDLTSDHGGAGSSLFGTGKSLSFDGFGALMYSPGSGASPAIPGVSLLIEGQQAGFFGSATVDGTSVFTPGFAISGDTTHEFLFTLQTDGVAIPEGVYGIAYRVKGHESEGEDYTPTPLLVATWRTPNFDPGDDPLAPNSPWSQAQSAIYLALASPVPEPSSVVLLALGAASAAGWGWHRRRAARAQRISRR
ncbi:MAG: PEP-CTERM sorting domain-containing protein [Pirellulales bacterium]